MDDKENIFSESFNSEKTGKKTSEEVKIGSEKKISKRSAGIIGAFIIGGIILAGVYGIGLFGNNEPFDPSGCHYGVHSDFFGQRCITLEEYELSQKVKETTENMNPIEMGESIDKPVDQSSTAGGGGTKDVSSATDKVELQKTNDILGYYLITTDDTWYGDYVDFRKLPNKIDKEGSMKISFRCFNDDFLKTSTYFGTFRNNLLDKMKVEVFINDKKVNEQSTNINKALILEGSCYQ